MVDMVNIIFLTSDGERIESKVRVGTTILEAAKNVHAPLPGACEGSLACSTCHVILESKEDFEITKQNLENNELLEEEEDLLDMAPEVSPTSRLGCQIIVSKDMEGMVFKLPTHTRND